MCVPSLVGVVALRQNVCLQTGEAARLVAALADAHVQQVGVEGCVVHLQQTPLDGLGWGQEKSYAYWRVREGWVRAGRDYTAASGTRSFSYVAWV